MIEPVRGRAARSWPIVVALAGVMGLSTACAASGGTASGVVAQSGGVARGLAEDAGSPGRDLAIRACDELRSAAEFDAYDIESGNAVIDPVIQPTMKNVRRYAGEARAYDPVYLPLAQAAERAQFSPGVSDPTVLGGYLATVMNICRSTFPDEASTHGWDDVFSRLPPPT